MGYFLAEFSDFMYTINGNEKTAKEDDYV